MYSEVRLYCVEEYVNKKKNEEIKNKDMTDGKDEWKKRTYCTDPP